MAGIGDVLNTLIDQLNDINADFDNTEVPVLIAQIKTITQIFSQLRCNMTPHQATTTYYEAIENINMEITQLVERAEERNYSDMRWYQKLWHLLKKLVGAAKPIIQIAGLLGPYIAL